MQGEASAQIIAQLHIATVTRPLVTYELDQRRGVLQPTRQTIDAGVHLVTLPVNREWALISSDPLLFVSTQALAETGQTCSLSGYRHHTFFQGPRLELAAQRLVPTTRSGHNQPIVLGHTFALAENLNFGSTHLVAPALEGSPLTSPAWLDPHRYLFDELAIVQPHHRYPLVQDTAFLDFAECYETHLSAEVYEEPGPVADVSFHHYANGQEAALKFDVLARRLDAELYALDRDVLRFGIVAPNRRMPDSLLSKRFHGIESYSVWPLFAHTNWSQKLADLKLAIHRSFAGTSEAWKLAIFQLLFADTNVRGISNVIFTYDGRTVLIDHKFRHFLDLAVPCKANLAVVTDRITFSAGNNNERDQMCSYLQSGNFAGFSQWLHENMRISLGLTDEGTAYSLLMPYYHLLDRPMPETIRAKLRLALHTSAASSQTIDHYFDAAARTYQNGSNAPKSSIEALAEEGKCLFFGKLRWLVDHGRLPHLNEGIGIAAACNPHRVFPQCNIQEVLDQLACYEGR